MKPVSDSSEETPPYWLLISVLFSSFPMTPGLAMTLHHAAYELHRNGNTTGEVAGDLVSGRVTNLKKHVLLGTIGGPSFEAELETERGPGKVKFILTREGLELMQAREEKRPRYLN